MYTAFIQALLVTGGWPGRWTGGLVDRKDLSSTEIYIYDHNDGSEWSYAASLPSGRNKPAAVTLDNSVLLFGEFIFWINYINNNLCINVLKEELTERDRRIFSDTMEPLTNG